MLTERELQFVFSGEKVGTLNVSGLRAYAATQSYTGPSGTIAQVKVWGLTMAQMDTYSSAMPNAVSIENFNLAINAGDRGAKLAKIIEGTIFRSFIDLAAAPESAFDVSVVVNMKRAATPIAAQSHPGPQAAETLIQSVCRVAGLTLMNNGAHAMLRGMSTNGDAIKQIGDIAHAAKFHFYIDGDTVWVWPYGGRRDDTIVSTGPDAGMVGYPSYWENGIVVRTLFNQDIQVGRRLKVTSSIPKANGTWPIIGVHHDLATMMRDGPWFTTAILTTGSTSNAG